MTGTRKILAWTGLTLLSLAFLFFGGTKLAGAEMHIENFASWGYPTWFVYVTGAIEVLGAALIIFPATRWIGGGLLAATMAGAVTTHIAHAEWAALALPLVLLAITGTIAWRQRPRALLTRSTTLDPREAGR
ncbi:MAG: DoxX family protein [Candidatus Thermoplasmatota archaeon]|nr:DoxX family protein [Candidatus Thermoplasmatota archaeon]